MLKVGSASIVACGGPRAALNWLGFLRSHRLRVIVVIPTYNEAENLTPLVAEIHALKIPELSILVIDDNSPDGTGRIAEELADKYSGFLSIRHRSGERGFTASYREGFQLALAMGADCIIQMDADFSHQPKYLPMMLEILAGEADLVIGSRYVLGGSVAPEWNFLRRWLSRFANQYYIRNLLGLPVQDATGGFRAWRNFTLEKVSTGKLLSSGYAFQVEKAYLCHLMGFRIVEIPIHFPDRLRGESKMSWRIALEAAWRVLQFRWRYGKLRSKNWAYPNSVRR